MYGRTRFLVSVTLSLNMAKQFYFLVITILLSTQTHSLTIDINGVINPYSLIDEAKEQVDELRTIVTAAINDALDGIDDFIQNAKIYFEERLIQVELSIQAEYDTHVDQLNTLKDLAEAAGKNIEVCLQGEEILHQLPVTSYDKFRSYLETATTAVQNIETTYKYQIDVLINEVDVLDFQLTKCGEEFLCAAPIITKVETAMSTLPQQIDYQKNFVRNSLEMQKMSVYSYLHASIAGVAIDGRIIIEEISSCIDQILSSS